MFGRRFSWESNVVTFYMFLSASVILGFIYITLFLPARFHSEEINEYEARNITIKKNIKERAETVDEINEKLLK